MEFLGFNITKEGIKTTDEFLNNILHFPAPKNITDVRAWYGAINQISFSFASAPIMAPFRHLLSAKVPFHWNSELQEAFEASKQEIITQCSKGVRSFDPKLPTALATDWSRLGLGFWLTQKHCSCQALLPGCCSSGWQTVFVGSRFCTASESRFHPIEGEALAIFYGLEKCKFFILGLPDLIVCVDHNPLKAIFGTDKIIETIHNPRLLNYKLKSMKFKFTVHHIPGKLNVIPDTLSRRSDAPTTNKPVTTEFTMQTNVSSGYADHLGQPSWVSPPTTAAVLHEAEDLMTGYTIAAMAEINSSATINTNSAQSSPQAISWSRLESACITCPEYTLLHNTVQQGVPDNKDAWDEQIKDYHTHRHSLTTLGPVVLLHDRPIIPSPLRRSVMEHLHAGHQGATAMFERASSSLYWPNFRQDLINHTARCTTCSRYQPSNPALPPVIPDEPSYPFQSICADFFSISPHTYLAIVDRYSNWLSIFKLQQDTSQEVIKVLRGYASTFGIPVVLTSDGAKVFTSKAMEDFCTRFGIIHRVSTAYHPRANKRSEVAVKSAKRMIRGNTSQTGTLDTDTLARALLQHRNTPCPLTGVSPAQIVFGRVLRDFLPLQPGKFLPREEWRLASQQRERAYSQRRMLKQEQLTQGSRSLPPILPGSHVRIQNQRNNKQWDQTGVVLEILPNDAYLISVNGSRTVTKRNRQFLRTYTPIEDDYAIPKPKPATPVKAAHPAKPYAPPTLPLPLPVSPQPTPSDELTHSEESTPTPVNHTPAHTSSPPQQHPHMDHSYCRRENQSLQSAPDQYPTTPDGPVMSALNTLNPQYTSIMHSTPNYMIPYNPYYFTTPQPLGQTFFPSPILPRDNIPGLSPPNQIMPNPQQSLRFPLNTMMSGIKTIQ